MPAPILELIAQASDPAVKTADLLRKAKVIAHRCQLSDQLAWIDLELRGYRESDPLPLYRFIRAPVYLRDVQTGEFTDLFTFHTDGEIPAQAHLCFDSISKLEALGSQGTLYVQLPSGHRVYDGLSAKARDQYQVVHQLDAVQLHAVVAQVRDKVLDWALELAKAGIEGDGIPSPPQPLAPVTVHIEGGFHGGQVMVSSPGGQQQQTVIGEQKAAGPSGLAQGSADAQRQPADRDTRQSEQDTLKPQAATAKRKWPLIVVLAGSSVLAVLQGAGGGVLSELVLKWLAGLSGG